MKILVIDDEKTILKTFELRLSSWGHEVMTASDGAMGLETLSRDGCQVVITDLKMPGLRGEEVVRKIREGYPEVEIVVITGFATVESAVEVMKHGATDFFIKPLNFDQVRLVLEKIEKNISMKEENLQLRNRVRELRSQVSKQYKFDNLVGKSRQMNDVFDLIRTVAPLDCAVAIYGETGTGKELVARAIHHNSARSSGPMITVDCGVLTETLLESELFGHQKGAFTGAEKTRRGRFEMADGGTIFLDEVPNASSAVQKKILRFLQEKTLERLGSETSIKSDARLITASNRDLAQMVGEGSFRQDLFYRLSVFPIHLTPLREREEDIPLLARYFLDRFARRMGREPLVISPGAIEQLTRHSWPGNVRELSNVMERAVIISSNSVIRNISLERGVKPQGSSDLGSVILHPPLNEQITSLELNYLKLSLKACRGRIKEVAKQSGLSPRTLCRKMKRYNLDKKDFR